jgi:hypothetical protein
MQLYSENQIRTLYSEFRSHKKYTDKLAFFDKNFGIIPFPFPDFDPLLGYFFQDEKANLLNAIYKKERNNPGLTEKKFSFRENFVFSIKPANSNSAAYSSFILSRFLARAPEFEEWIRFRSSPDKPADALLDEANGLVNQIEYRLQFEYDKSFKLQCMSVFFKGFYDAFCKRANLPGKKRKFIELYLYAQGIIYAHYIRSLKAWMLKSRCPEEVSPPSSLDFSGKLFLLKELGILEFLKKKFSRLDPFSFENKIAEIIRLITSENVEEKELILSLQEGWAAN